MSASSIKPRISSLAPRVNVADRLAHIAVAMPEAVAVACPGRGDVAGEHTYRTCTFGELDADATAIARGFIEQGVQPGTRLALLVPPGVEFVKLVFGLLRSGATTVLIDPGMGRKHFVKCLAAAEPDGFVAIPMAHAARVAFSRRFPRARFNVTLGRRWFWGGVTYRELLRRGRQLASSPTPTHGDDPGAIIFTSGSTGPPKGVLYSHEMFETQVEEIQREYQLGPGGVDLACFALFGLFNCAMGVTTVFPDMNFSRPAAANPRKLLAAASDWQVMQAFASPAVWDKLSRHCEASGERIPTLRKVFSCGAAVPADVLQRTLGCVHANAEMHTPYGATEALPVSTIESHEVLGETAARTRRGEGVCVGRKVDSIEWRVIRISDEPIATLADAEELTAGEIGELIVRGPQVSPNYVISITATQPRPPAGGRRAMTAPIPTGTSPPPEAGAAMAKIRDGDSVWHRMGDAGYLDDEGRFWYCGRRSQRVETAAGTIFTECCEAVFSQHSAVRRAALVGIGPPGSQSPVVIIESTMPELQPLRAGRLSRFKSASWNRLVTELLELGAAYPHTASIGEFLLHPSLPVDVRHNSKINREELARWAVRMIADQKLRPHHDPRMLSEVDGMCNLTSNA